MIIILQLRWWYSAGWRWVLSEMLIAKVQWVNEVFSTSDLLRTLFAPFRQTYAGGVRGSVGDQFRAFVDRSISRVIGFIVRSFLLIAAALGSVAIAVSGLLTLLLWPFLPFLPFIGFICFVVGVGV
jgi:hypothetical protein